VYYFNIIDHQYIFEQLCLGARLQHEREERRVQLESTFLNLNKVARVSDQILATITRM
jgi:hypothetical protein